MQEEQALDFYDRIVGGKDKYETISLEHSSGAILEGVEMHPVSKQRLASVIQELPDEMFEDVDGEVDAEDAQEQLDGADANAMGAVTKETVKAFEELCKDSLQHPSLTRTQMGEIVDELSFEILFEVGTSIIDMSVETTGAIRDFQRQG